MFKSLAGRSVLVTGGTKGIGKGIARVFADAGANVMVMGRDPASGEETTRALAACPGRVTFASGDVSLALDCDRVAAQTIATYGGIDVLCANAGIAPMEPFPTMSESDIDQLLATNLKGTIFSMRACFAALAKSGRGRVIITSSITGSVTGHPGFAYYGATKAAQLGLMRSAAVEWAASGITVNAVLPGNIATEGLDDLGDEHRGAMERSNLFGRLGTPEEIGYAALFFATEEAGYITGQQIVVDGGQILPETWGGPSLKEHT